MVPVGVGVFNRDDKLDSMSTTTLFVGNGDHICNHHHQNNNSVFSHDDKNNVVKGTSIAERRNLNLSNGNFVVPRSAQTLDSHYFTVPPGISPSTLLNSPALLLNDQVPLSPTTGTFQFNSTNPESCVKLTHKISNPYGNANGNFHSEVSNVTDVQDYSHLFSDDFIAQTESPCQAFEELKCPTDFQEMAKTNSFADPYAMSSGQNLGNNSPWSGATAAANQVFTSQNDSNGKDQSKNTSREKQQKGSSTPKDGSKYLCDGYYWKKYGQKQVKGSEYPRSYFKCTSSDCLVKKKVESSHDGVVTEIVYDGTHNHEAPAVCGEENEELCITQGEDWRNDGLDREFYCDSSVKSPFKSQALSPPFGSQDSGEKGEYSPGGISVNDDETGEGEPKRRKRDETNTVSRSNREPRIVVQIESESDTLDDGYRWRKYGQKVVKGNPNPRSYYKCTTPECPVRKHVERAANDAKAVIITYEGKHNHEVPSSKNNTSMVTGKNAGLASTLNIGTNLSASMVHRADHMTGNQAPDLYSDRTRYHGFGSYGNLSSLNQLVQLPRMNSLSNTNYTMPFSMPYFNMNTTTHAAGLGNVLPLGNSYAAVQPASRGQEVYKDYQLNIMKRKQEQRNNGGLYDASSVSMPNLGIYKKN